MRKFRSFLEKFILKKRKMKPVIVRLKGGLGNQMFQYSTGRALSIYLKTDLILELSWFLDRKEPHEKYALDPFNIKAKKVINYKYFPSFIRKFIIEKRTNKYKFLDLGKLVFKEKSFTFDRDFFEINNPLTLDGYWQSEKYFQNIKDILKRDFKIKNNLPIKVCEIKEKINSFCSICIHIRRNDFVKNTEISSVHGVCSLDYYKEAINLLIKNNPSNDLRALVFSDDFDWVKTNFEIPIPKILVDINNPLKPHLDLELMRNCNKFIIANSSFSWWAAWLCEHDNKEVIAPQNWFNSSHIDTIDLIPKSWEII